jgi:hypothetical protein
MRYHDFFIPLIVMSSEFLAIALIGWVIRGNRRNSKLINFATKGEHEKEEMHRS